MLHRGQSYRRIDLIFPTLPEESALRLDGVEEIRTRGRQMSVMASRNAEDVVARAHDFSPSSVDVSPVGLREIFLEKVKETSDALV
jgi:ABC-2 type transport system ATP-binding protein